jgi:hypothetical protein
VLWGNAVPTHFVNLDALILRQDMEAGEQRPSVVTKDITHTELEVGKNTFTVLRKPDFQRETSMWTPEKVKDLIVAYAEEDLVPAVVLWRSAKNDLFVIDGAHRLSSLIAWVNDDYGDDILSQKFFGDISPQQKTAAILTRKLVEDAVGKYKTISEAFKNPNTPEIYVQRAKRLVNCFIRVQPLETTDINKAERSFFKINEQGVPLTEGEKRALHSRDCPNTIAARAINQRGKGHQHWDHFAAAMRDEIKELSAETYKFMFEPELVGRTIKTSDVPIAGKYSPSTALALLVNTINIANKVADTIPDTTEEAEQIVPKDETGESTISFLKRTKRIMVRILNRSTTDAMASLDLHPFVYFYADNSRHRPSTFLAIVELMSEYEDQNKFKDFTLVRAELEDFLVANSDLVQQVSRRARGEMKAVHNIKSFFDFIVNEFSASQSEDAVIAAIQKSKEWGFLKIGLESDEDIGKDFSPKTKSKGFIAEKLKTDIRCTICGALVPDRGVSFDHKQSKESGGMGDDANLQFTHHYCNSAKKMLTPLFEAKKLKGAAVKA